MLNVFIKVEKLIYSLVDFYWEVPDKIFSIDITKTLAYKYYKATSPFSHFLTSFLAVFSLFCVFTFFSPKQILGFGDDTYLEAVVVGVDAENKMQQISAVNPLNSSNSQIEKDLVELIYEPLLRYEFLQKDDGTWGVGAVPVLIEKIVNIKTGADYQIKLKKNILWHDGKKFTSEDVKQTFELILKLNLDDAYAKTLRQLNWKVVDEHTIDICTKTSDTDKSSCGNTNLARPVISNLLELLSFKILPAHKIAEINIQTFQQNTAGLFKKPIGTGILMIKNVEIDSITLTANTNHSKYQSGSSLKNLKFVFFASIADAQKALESSQVHSFATSSIQKVSYLKQFKNININQSSTLDNQFYGLFFNLRKNLDNKAISKDFLLDRQIRKAIAFGINKEYLVKEGMDNIAEVAVGPISPKSYYFNPKSSWPVYNVTEAKKILDEKGWLHRDGNPIRTNASGEKMEFSLYFVESFDRRKIAENIKSDLAKIGINVLILKNEQVKTAGSTQVDTGWNLSDLNDQILAPRLFDVILYGVETFVDPDRYELFHSSQVNHPNLNISSYVGEDQTLVAIPIAERVAGGDDKKKVSKVDNILENTRKLDPDNIAERKVEYDKFQDLLAVDVPVIPLYHPKFLYYTNKAVKGLNLENVQNVEDRFKNFFQLSLSN